YNFTSWVFPQEMKALFAGSPAPAENRELGDMPKLQSVEEGRALLNRVREKIEKASGKSLLAGFRSQRDRGRLIQNLQKNLTPSELGFVGLALTAFGEARGQVSADCSKDRILKDPQLQEQCVTDPIGRKNLLLVMKILENRSLEARLRGAKG